MAMTYTSLVAPKGTAGSLLNWIGYGKVDISTVLDEAQSLLYQILRVREMRTEWTFGLTAGQATQPLPVRFLDPAGKVLELNSSAEIDHSVETRVQRQRAYNQLSGTFGANPFTTTLNSSQVSCVAPAHALTEDSTVTTAGTTAVGGLSLNGTFPVIAITDANTFVLDAGDNQATSSGTGGGTGGSYTANQLVSGVPASWAVWGEKLRFNTAFDAAATCKLLYYRQPLLLSATNPNNFLTDRYPKLLRIACMAAAADFMRDDNEYTKQVQTLNNLIQTTMANDDMFYRGANFGTETP